MNTIKQLKYIFDKRQKIKIIILGFIIVIGALLELVGITAILPFVNVAMKPESVYNNKYLFYFYTKLGISSPNIFLAFLALTLIFIYIIKNVYLALMNYGIFRFTYNNQRNLSLNLLRAYLKQPYTFFLKMNSADLMRNVNIDTSMLFDSVLSFMQLMVESIVCALLLGFLMITDKSITLGVGVVLVAFLLVMTKTMKKNIETRGQRVRDAKALMSKWLLQTFGGIKETKILERENFFEKKFDEQFAIFANNHCVYQTLSYLPKPTMETVCIGSVLLVVAFKLIKGVQSEYFISTISVFAVAAFRLLPAFNRIMGYISRIMYNKTGVDAVYHDLKEVEKLEKQGFIKSKLEQEIPFEKEIRIENLSFLYPETIEYVIKNVNLQIPKNSAVAFIGPSGAGKTTLADIILGVLNPNNGRILVDDIDVGENMMGWHQKLGYIPQSIYLLDDTIRNNIAFAIPKEQIDDKRIEEVLEEAQLKNFIDSLEEGIDTVIGEQGVRLSGGQRQRIGIARALYNNPEILILDEATSALDNDTELAVMNAIDSLAGKKTILIIAHRLSTIKNCNMVYEIKNNGVTLVKNSFSEV